MDLPIELIVGILKHCDSKSFINFGKTCSCYHALLSNNEIWNQMCRNDFRQHRSVILYGFFSYLALFNSAKINTNNPNIPLFRPDPTPMQIFKQEFRKYSKPIKRKHITFVE